MGKGKGKSRLRIDTTENVRIDSELVGLVRKHKKESGIPVGRFFEMAAKKELLEIELREAEKVGGKK